jgi:hypothetical protein
MGETIRTYKASFNGGELTPEFFGQIGDAKFQTGLATVPQLRGQAAGADREPRRPSHSCAR